MKHGFGRVFLFREKKYFSMLLEVCIIYFND